MPSGELEALAAKVEAVLKDPALRARQLAVFAESLAFIRSHNPSLWLTNNRLPSAGSSRDVSFGMAAAAGPG